MTVIAVAAAGAATLPFQPHPELFPPQAIRCMLIGCVAFLTGATAVTLVPGRRPVRGLDRP